MRKLAILFSISLLSSLAIAQPGFDPFFGTQPELKSPGWRKIANMFTIEGSFGHGATLYSHDVSGFPLSMTRDSVLYLGAATDTGVVRYVSGLTNWLNAPIAADTTAIFAFSYAGDSVLGFRAINNSIPVNLRVYWHYDRFRLGAGIQYEWQWFKPMNPTNYQAQLGPYRPAIRRSTLSRYFAMAGVRYYTYRKMTYVVDAEVGLVKMGSGFETLVPNRRLYFNLGFPIEYNFSEYLRVYVRPSLDFKRYELDLGGYSVLTHKQNAFNTQFGISFTFPELQRCPVPACHVQMKHVHQGYEFRGQPINKVQNPGYGENHPKLTRHKWRPFNRGPRTPTPRKWQFWRRN